MTDETYAFGAFRLIPTARTLLDNGRAVRLGSRALDLLIALVEQAGTTVSKEKLMASVWPDTVVDEASVRVHVAALRKALGDGRDGARFISNIPGRGYAFVAPVTQMRAEAPATNASLPPDANSIPVPLTHVIGRDTIIQTLSAQVGRRRLLTILGPGGIGKTTAAAAIAETVRASFQDGVWFVPLASVRTADLLATAIGGVFGISLPQQDPVAGLIAWLGARHALVVLDNCEHLIDAVAALAEAVIRSAPDVHLLATSREPLRVQGEWRHRLAPLEFPAPDRQETVATALTYPAVQLFSERAVASADQFTITDDDVPAVLEICRRLDGVPLALELAAAHVEAFGIKGLATRLHDRIPLMIQGRRTAAPRQQTLRAALDWSYDLLPNDERIILRRLSAFQGDFTLTAAGAVAADDTLSFESVCNGVADLVDKSLITADIGGSLTYYRLLEITRTYAQQRLQESDEQDQIARRHAVYFRDLFANAQEGSATRSRAEWNAIYGRDVANLRTALHWAFSPDGDVALGVSLAAAATDLWMALSLHAECCDWAAKAVARLGPAVETRDEMILQCGLGHAITRSRGAPAEVRAALSRALTLAQRMRDADYQFRALFGLWLSALRQTDFAECMALCHQCEELTLATDDAAGQAVADMVYGESLYFLGEYGSADERLARARAGFVMERRGGYLVRYSADVVVAALSYRAVTFWSLGLADSALRAGQQALEEARAIGNPVSVCVALAAPRSTLLLHMGYLDEAERHIDMLIEHARAHSLTPYHAYGLCSKGCVAAARGDLAEAEALLRHGLQRSREAGYALYCAYFEAELAGVLRLAGRMEEGLLEIDATLDRVGESGAPWCLPELLRIKGELTGAEAWFTQALDLARRQGALSWELRTATSLARRWRGRGQHDQGRALIQSVYRKFTEGFETADLRAAREFL